MFEEPIQSKKVRNGVFAYKYPNGVINIEGIQYYFYSMTDAINTHRRKYPKYKK